MRIEWIKKKLQVSVEQMLRHRIYCFSHRKHGHQSYADIRHSGQHVNTIFDVGANTGQSAFEYMVTFPHAKIICFEPVSSTYAELESNMRGTGVQCRRLALGDREGESQIYLTDNSTTSSLIPQEQSKGQETVEVTTVDLFAHANGIGSIDLLKIDTEGFDLEVLKGAGDMLSSGAVAFVQVEVGFHPCDKRHVLFDDARDFLIDKGFSVFGFYDQFLEWSGEQRLRFANALFYRHPPLVSKGQELDTGPHE